MSRSNKASSSFKETSMATAYQNLSEYDFRPGVPDAEDEHRHHGLLNGTKHYREKAGRLLQHA